MRKLLHALQNYVYVYKGFNCRLLGLFMIDSRISKIQSSIKNVFVFLKFKPSFGFQVDSCANVHKYAEHI